MHHQVPSALIRKWRRQLSSSASQGSAELATPALLTSASTGPSSARVSAAAAWT